MESKLLVLDLDETLIFAAAQPLSVECDARVGRYYIYERPNVRQFLEFCLSEFEVAVWTSSTADYAQGVVDHLFGGSGQLSFVWARDRCTQEFDPSEYCFRYAKNLKKVKKRGYELEKILVVDDTPEKWDRQYGNLVRVSAYEGDQSDTELLDLAQYLAYLKTFENVRKVEKRGWRSATDWRDREIT